MTSAGRAQGFLLWQQLCSRSTLYGDHDHNRHRGQSDELLLWLNSSSEQKPGCWVDSLDVAAAAVWDLQVCRRSVEAGLGGWSTSSGGQAAGPAAAATNEVVGMYARCRNVCETGDVSEAVHLLSLRVQQGYHVPNDLYFLVLKRCNVAHQQQHIVKKKKHLDLGKRIHELTVSSGYQGNAFLATHLIGFYASHGELEEAKRVFFTVPTPDAYNWASIIFACAKLGHSAQAIGLFGRMCESNVSPDNRIYVAVLKACARARDLVAGKDVHARILCATTRGGTGKADLFVQTCLVDMYAKCGSLEDARRVFDGLVEKDVVAWTAMIAGYAQQGMYEDALDLYSRMQDGGMNPPDAVTYVCLLQACANVGPVALHQGKQLHAQIEARGLQDDVVVGASLVNMFAKCGSVEDASTVFDKLRHRNLVTWTAMIAGYTQQGMGKDALSMYTRMMQQESGVCPPDSVTFLCLLQACSNVGVAALREGKQIHAQIEERGMHGDVVLGAALVNMYAKLGSLGDAQRVFDRLKMKDVVTWTAMITGYSHEGKGEEALGLYSHMRQEGIAVPPDAVTYVSLLQACASVVALDQGKQLHAEIVERGLQDGAGVGAGLVSMYAKCGSLVDARKAFDRMPRGKGVVTWNAMIAGYAQQGMGQEALSLYQSMREEDEEGGAAVPDTVTYVSLLQACASVADLPVGQHLHAQVEARGLQADENVGSSLVNMYAKCGRLELAHQVFESLVFKGTGAWSALIAGYARQGHSSSEVVFGLFDRMRREGVRPNGVTFLSVLAACSHAGLVDQGRHYLEVMVREFGIVPSVEHYACRMDLLGRAGHLTEALQLARAITPGAAAVWLSLLGACQKWNNVEVGVEAFEGAVGVDETDATAYMVMSNIYAGAGMWDEAEEVQARRVKAGAWKQPGQSWCMDSGGVVHTFLVGEWKTEWPQQQQEQEPPCANSWLVHRQHERLTDC